MASIGSLSTELLDQISQHVYYPADMLCFSLVDRRFRSIMHSSLKQAKAWHRIYVSIMDDGPESSISENPECVDPLRAVVRSIIQLSERHRYWVMYYAENPNVPLAAFENVWKSTAEVFDKDPKILSIITSDKKLFADAAKTMGLSRIDRLMMGLSKGIPVAYLGLLLSLCPNLRSIEYVNGQRLNTLRGCWEYVVDHPGTTSSFRCLRDVSCVPGDRECGLDFVSLFPLFRLPSMRSLNAHMTLNYHPE